MLGRENDTLCAIFAAVMVSLGGTAAKREGEWAFQPFHFPHAPSPSATFSLSASVTPPPHNLPLGLPRWELDNLFHCQIHHQSSLFLPTLHFILIFRCSGTKNSDKEETQVRIKKTPDLKKQPCCNKRFFFILVTSTNVHAIWTSGETSFQFLTVRGQGKQVWWTSKYCDLGGPKRQNVGCIIFWEEQRFQ